MMTGPRYQSHGRSYSDSTFWLLDSRSFLPNADSYGSLRPTRAGGAVNAPLTDSVPAMAVERPSDDSLKHPINANRDVINKMDSEIKHFAEYGRSGRSVSQSGKEFGYGLLSSTAVKDVDGSAGPCGELSMKDSRIEADLVNNRPSARAALWSDNVLLSPYTYRGRWRTIDQVQSLSRAGAEKYEPMIVAGPGCSHSSFVSSSRSPGNGEPRADIMYHQYSCDATKYNPPMTSQDYIPYYGIQHGRSKSDISRTVFCTKHRGRRSDRLSNGTDANIGQQENCNAPDNCIVEHASQNLQSISVQTPPSSDQQQAQEVQDPQTGQKISSQALYTRRLSRQSLHKYTICSNCGTEKTSLWRRSSNGEPLCNACGLFRKLHGSSRPISLKTDVIRKRNRSRGSVVKIQSQMHQNSGNRSKNRKSDPQYVIEGGDGSFIRDLPSSTRDPFLQDQKLQPELQKDNIQEECDVQSPEDAFEAIYTQNKGASQAHHGSQSDQARGQGSNNPKGYIPQYEGPPYNMDYHSFEKSDRILNSGDRMELGGLSLEDRVMIEDNILLGMPGYWPVSHVNSHQPYPDESAAMLPPSSSAQCQRRTNYGHSSDGRFQVTGCSPQLGSGIQSQQQVIVTGEPTGYLPADTKKWNVGLSADAPNNAVLPFARTPLVARSRSCQRGLHRHSPSGDAATAEHHSQIADSLAVVGTNQTTPKNCRSPISPFSPRFNERQIPTSPIEKPILHHGIPAPLKEFPGVDGSCTGFDIYRNYRDAFPISESHPGSAPVAGLRNIPTPNHLTT